MFFYCQLVSQKTFILILVFTFLIGATFSIQAQEVDDIKEKLVAAFKKKQGQVNLKLEAGIEEINLQTINQIVETAVEESNEYYQFTVESWNLEAEGNSCRTQISISLSYLTSYREDKYVFNQVKKMANELFTTGMGRHQKVKAVNDYLISRIEYDETLRNKTAYDALKTGLTTCRGYALLTYLLLRQAGIKNQIVTGKLRGEPELHAWNLIYLEGNWYHLDVTQNAVHYPDKKVLIYGWYNLSDRALSSTHIWDLNDYPAAEKSYLQELENLIVAAAKRKEVYKQLIKNLNLYYLQDEYTVFSYEKLERKLKEAFTEKNSKITFRTTPDLVKEINRIMQTLYRRYSDLSQVEEYKLKQVTYNRDTYSNTIVLTINFSYK